MRSLNHGEPYTVNLNQVTFFLELDFLCIKWLLLTLLRFSRSSLHLDNKICSQLRPSIVVFACDSILY